MTPRTATSIARLTVTLLLLLGGGSSARAQQPPHIFFAEAPALLVQVDGAPKYRRIPGSDLERLVNTKAFIVRDTADVHYLKVLDGWMESYGLMGHWAVSGVSPFGENRTLERAVLATATDRLDGGSAASLDDAAPAVFIWSEPAVLIVTDGPPRFETVPGTSLQYLVNTRATVFREPTDEELYLRVAGSGDWYRAWRTDGPWQFIPALQLPSDIARQIQR